ncbi:N-acetylmuramoyl-L-alanine amidase [Actinomadura fulvescens]|uniref:N-acetylmuramoyl-L-alanine amidase domain-containing protein n=1 Tax=Actinomadura fulvescens TaxID=46160 RepID=A0ABN3PKR3_9ACTN
MTHWDGIARKGYITLHHTATASSDTTNHTAPSDCSTIGYDFQVLADGTIYPGGRKFESPGCHGRSCNCNSTGIALTGCFGGCSGNTGNAYPTTAQECAVGYIWAHTGIPSGPGKIKPHRWCAFETPCDTPGTSTVCPGTNLTGNGGAASDYFNQAGIDMRNRLDAKRNQYAGCDACACT